MLGRRCLSNSGLRVSRVWKASLWRAAKKRAGLGGVTMTDQEILVCKHCNSHNVVKRGFARSKISGLQTQQWRCNDCGKYMNAKEKSPVTSLTRIPLKKKKDLLEDFKYQEQPIPKTDWKAFTKAQQQEKESLFDITKELLSNIEIKYPAGKKGRKFADVKDMTFCLVAKTYTKLSSRRLDSDLREAQANEYISKVPHFTTLLNFLEKPELTALLQELVKISSLPVKGIESQYAIDASGFSTSQFGRWFDHKWGKESIRRTWVKGHIMCGTFTNIVTSVELTKGNCGDSPYLEPLVKKTCTNFNVREISADKGYSSRKNFEIISNAGAHPFIPFKSNALARQKGSMIWSKCYKYFYDQPQNYLQHYHKRSNVETCFSMIKQKFGKDLMTKNFNSQCNEILLKIFCHNLCCLIQAYYENSIETYYSTEAEKLQIQAF